MIDKINGNGGYDFKEGTQNQKKNPAVRAYENTPGFQEAAKKKTPAVHKKNTSQPKQKETGVILDLSGSKTGQKIETESFGPKKDAAWTDVLRKLFAPAIKWLKNFWESDHTKEQNEKDILSETSDLSEMNLEDVDDIDRNLPPLQPLSVEEAEQLETIDHQKAQSRLEESVKNAALKSKNLKQIERLVTQNGTKRLAHNSDLLTYYDRRGKFVEIDETEKHRVLFGDKNILKL